MTIYPRDNLYHFKKFKKKKLKNETNFVKHKKRHFTSLNWKSSWKVFKSKVYADFCLAISKITLYHYQSFSSTNTHFRSILQKKVHKRWNLEKSW